MRSHLDESADGRIAAGLRHRGIDVTTPVEVGLRGASDQEHLAYALANGRVLVTHDADFLDFHNIGRPHNGIAYSAPSTRPIGHLIRLLCLMHDCMSEEEIRGNVEYL